MRRVWLAIPLMFLLCATARGESSSTQGTGGLAASASIDFKIVIPEVLALRVGGDGSTEGSTENSLQRVRFDPANPVVRGARSGLALDVTTAGATNGVMLRSNMRQITVTQDSGSRTTYTVATP